MIVDETQAVCKHVALLQDSTLGLILQSTENLVVPLISFVSLHNFKLVFKVIAFLLFFAHVKVVLDLL